MTVDRLPNTQPHHCLRRILVSALAGICLGLAACASTPILPPSEAPSSSAPATSQLPPIEETEDLGPYVGDAPVLPTSFGDFSTDGEPGEGSNQYSTGEAIDATRVYVTFYTLPGTYDDMLSKLSTAESVGDFLCGPAVDDAERNQCVVPAYGGGVTVWIPGASVADVADVAQQFMDAWQ